ncbi:uncharacterized protein PV07_03105 [Cladophialophora immunda]|uniref:AB hydrolase-1 domain-containing protein n=1 Tax=Cladophialophora immunda TaxID=569365 RepID=A0A0D2B1H4_9EURO|nr:uncharacterized protein PV07_03105 [Cladophialophora immunda]KIW31457.1 hypothetical protein PV07_03105 [Cladophialophora immunda]OQV08099.1 hypothetical protein CLAIMM_12420 [Cladophialophora immunda]
MTEKPTLVFVPGAWHSSACYGKVIECLQSCGYTCKTMELATVNPANPAIDDADTDSEIISTTIENILSTGKNVFLVVHSYGGIPASSATHSFRDRTSPGVMGIAMIAAFLPPPKTSLVALLEKHPTTSESGFHKFDSTGHLIEVGGAGPETLLYNDLPAEEAGLWASRLQPHSWICNIKPPSAHGVGWHHIPTHYLICGKDQVVPPSLQRQMIDDANNTLVSMGSSLRIRGEVVESGHSPFLSMPVETANYIRRSVGEKI